MVYSIEIRNLAAIETIEAYDWYEEQLQGLGSDFLSELDSFYETLLLNPETFSFYELSVRQRHLSRFPYTVVYEVFDDVIVIYSIFMFRRDPDKKRKK